MAGFVIFGFVCDCIVIGKNCGWNLQVIVYAGVVVLNKLVATGTCVVVDGLLKVSPKGRRQKIELRVEKVVSIGEVDPAKYPIPKTKLTLGFLRDHLRVRLRANTSAVIARIWNALAFATHSNLTTSDCEGASEMFQVMTLISQSEKLEKELIKNPPPSEVDTEAQVAALEAVVNSGTKVSGEEFDVSVELVMS